MNLKFDIQKVILVALINATLLTGATSFAFDVELGDTSGYSAIGGGGGGGGGDYSLFSAFSAFISSAFDGSQSAVSEYVQFGPEVVGYDPNRNPISDPEINRAIDEMSPASNNSSFDGTVATEAVFDAIIGDFMDELAKGENNSPDPQNTSENYLDTKEFNEFAAAFQGLQDSNPAAQSDSFTSSESQIADANNEGQMMMDVNSGANLPQEDYSGSAGCFTCSLN